MSGHAECWDRIVFDGHPAARDFIAGFWSAGKQLAVASVGRDLESLRAEVGLYQPAGPLTRM